ncbi:uncharacterized protein LOC119084211 isoform X2 [Bradysia coprophila]|uniref:uncharacterized protein LOC119084211 isoform X2 n=1 Tax=Bradysia coprophila TaxID=38358 RepID=UPI00187DB4FF|nr:uncharacterized protein LOC119084211 isoform X2 [Bradysia coprophila]
MPFIWDDLYWHVIGKDEEYDKNPKYYYHSKALITFNRVHLRKEFENYGNIESVELLTNGKSEAYITFVDDKSAAMAFGLMNCENDLKITEREYLCFKKYNVHIANTWHQPTELTTSYDDNDRTAVNADDSTPAIFALNEDCLRQIFTFCDLESLNNLSQVCKTFNDLLSPENGSTTFRQFKTLRLVVDVVEKDRLGKLMTLGKARKFLKHVGPFVTKLVIKKLDEANVQRYFEKMVQYVGEDIKELEIYDVQLTNGLITIIQPILRRLSVLTIKIFKNSQDIDFEAVCPNVTKFKIAGIMSMERNCKCWPNLRHVSLLSDILLPETFCAFVTLNPHLNGLKFFHQNFQQIQSIVSNLSNLSKLGINCKYKPITALQLNHLVQLDHLTQLTLWNLTGHASIVEVFLVLVKFTGLRVLKLHISEDQNHEALDSTVYELKQQTLAVVAQKLINLETLMLFNIKLDESTVFDMVRSASQLKALHIHALSLNVEWNESLVTGILNIRKIQQHEHLLKLFLDRDLNVLISKGDQRYLRIYCYQFGCRHNKLKNCKK